MRQWVEIKAKRREPRCVKGLEFHSKHRFVAVQVYIPDKLLAIIAKGKEESVCLGRREKRKTPVCLKAYSYTCFFSGWDEIYFPSLPPTFVSTHCAMYILFCFYFLATLSSYCLWYKQTEGEKQFMFPCTLLVSLSSGVIGYQPSWAEKADAVSMIQRAVSITEGLLERASGRQLYIIISEVAYIVLLGVKVERDVCS